jgi:hypothetical protein
MHAVAESGEIPPGNEKGNTAWSLRRAPAKPEIRLTPGKGVEDLTCSVEDLVDQVVKSSKVPAAHTSQHLQHQPTVQICQTCVCSPQVVAFIKGTRTQPQCGFSHKVLTILNESGAPYEVVGSALV